MATAYQYSTPTKDINFALEVAGVNNPANAGVANIDTLKSGGELTDVLEQTVGPFAENELYPLYEKPGHVAMDPDQPNTVKLVDGYAEAYQKSGSEVGVLQMAAPEELGGAGMPKAFGAAVAQVFSGANNVFELTNALTRSVCAGLMHGAKEAEAGNPEGKLPSGLRDAFLRDLLAGNSTGVMAMTEPGAGSDLQANVTTRAEQMEDGRYRINGAKIYITSGDNEFTTLGSGRNIVHLALVRIGDDSKLSLMAIPKFPVDAEGKVKSQADLTEDEKAHRVYVGAVEDKMGLDHSATTQMYYDNAIGCLVGERGKGMANMFNVMNEARRAVGRQAIGIADLAFQLSFKHAKNEDGLGRVQGRAFGEAETPENPNGDPIIVHPSTREMLMRQRSFVEGARVLDLMTELEADAHGEDSPWVKFMTNVQKFHFSEEGFKAADLAVQIFGGSGYIKNTGIEKLERDARITRIYEGTNQIQAITMQLPLIGALEERVDSLLGDYQDETYTKVLQEGLDKLRAQKAQIAELAATDKNAFLAAAQNFMSLTGHVAMGYAWAKTAQLAQEKLNDPAISDADRLFYETKLATANFHNNVVLNEVLNGKQIVTLQQLEIPDAGIRNQSIPPEQPRTVAETVGLKTARLVAPDGRYQG